jgi:hypothetical protein
MFDDKQSVIKASKTTAKAHKNHTSSSGKRRCIKIRRAIRRLNMKIAHWERNKAEGKKSAIKRVGKGAKKPQRIGGKVASRGKWDTTGMKNHLVVLDNALNMRTVV